MIDFSKHKKGDIVHGHCCDNCIPRQGIIPKYPPDSDSKSWYCEICQHFAIGSTMAFLIGDWLLLRIQSTDICTN